MFHDNAEVAFERPSINADSFLGLGWVITGLVMCVVCVGETLEASRVAAAVIVGNASPTSMFGVLLLYVFAVVYGILGLELLKLTIMQFRTPGV